MNGAEKRNDLSMSELADASLPDISTNHSAITNLHGFHNVQKQFSRLV